MGIFYEGLRTSLLDGRGTSRANQVEELSNHLESHQGAHIGILPPGRVLAQAQYDIFFSTARKFKWLEF